EFVSKLDLFLNNSTHKDIFYIQKNKNNKVKNTIKNKAIHALLSLILNEETINWKSFYKTPPQKIPLPSYSFKKNKFSFNYPPSVSTCSNLSSKDTTNSTKISLRPINNISRNTDLTVVSLPNNTTNSPISLEKEKNTPAQYLEIASLLDILADVIYIKPSDINPTKPFQELGLDSVTGVELINKLNKKLNISLKATDLYNYTTPLDLFNLIQKQESAINYPSKTNTISNVSQQLNTSQHSTISDTLIDSKKTLLRDLQCLLEEVLFCTISEGDFDKEFQLLGLDSVTGVDLIQKIQKKYCIKIAATTLYDHTTLRTFSNFIFEEFFKNPSSSYQQSSQSKAPQETHIDNIIDQFNHDEISFEEALKEIVN
ncbi:hypothetical protein DID76_01535, partial [Candidatus Marinamargulisbacteria bacterium SCGC AG-414-C22]